MKERYRDTALPPLDWTVIIAPRVTPSPSPSYRHRRVISGKQNNRQQIIFMAGSQTWNFHVETIKYYLCGSTYPRLNY